MRLVDYIDGALEIRWTWLPYWLATNGRLKQDLERELASIVLEGPVTSADEDLDQLHDAICRMLQERFPSFPGLGEALKALKLIRPAEHP